MLDLRRRQFLALIGGAAAWPLAARAQQALRIPRLGVLLFSTPTADPQMETARRALRDLGYVEGRHLALDDRVGGPRGSVGEQRRLRQHVRQRQPEHAPRLLDRRRQSGEGAVRGG